MANAGRRARRGARWRLARLVIRRAMIEASGGRAVSFAHVEEALRLVPDGGAAGGPPGQRMQRNGGDVVLTARPEGAIGRPAGTAGRGGEPFSVSAVYPGEVRLAEAACVVIC